MDTEVRDYIHGAVTNHRVVLFMKGTPQFPQCGFSSRAIQILEHCGAEYATINVLADHRVREGIKEYSNWPTIPQCYIDGEFVAVAISCLRCIKTENFKPSSAKAIDHPTGWLTSFFTPPHLSFDYG